MRALALRTWLFLRRIGRQLFNNQGLLGLLGILLGLAIGIYFEDRRLVFEEASASIRVIDRAIEVSVEIGAAQASGHFLGAEQFDGEIESLVLLYYLGESRVEAAQPCLTLLVNDVIRLANDLIEGGSLPGNQEVILPPYRLILAQAESHKNRIVRWRNSHTVWTWLSSNRSEERFFSGCRNDAG